MLFRVYIGLKVSVIKKKSVIKGYIILFMGHYVQMFI